MSKLTVFIILSLFAMSLALYGPDSKVVKLTSANFREKVINSKELWFVEFYAPWCGHCKNLAPEWDKLAKSLEGIIRVGAVDMDSDRDAGASYGIQGFPTIKFFGADKNKPTDYNGGRSASDLLEFGLNQAKSVAQARLKGKATGGSSNQGGSHGGHQGGHGGSGGSSNDEDVVVLTEGNFDELLGNSEELWIVEFYAPWCGHCKRLEPEWNAAATKLKGEVKIAKVDSTVEGKLAQRFGVQGYPTIKMFPSGPKADHLAENYEGGRDSDSIVSWALEKKAQFKPAARVVQLTSQTNFDEQCGKNRGICLITFVPHLLDSSASERQELLDLLADVAKSQRKNPVTYLWAQGGDYFDVEEKFTLGSGYPAVVAVSVSKSKYAILRASFNKKNIESFIGGLLNGKESLFNLPAVSFKNVKEWDGKDAEKPKDDDL